MLAGAAGSRKVAESVQQPVLMPAANITDRN
jgi:hypothetical protein